MQSQKLADSVLDMLVSKNSDGGNSYDELRGQQHRDQEVGLVDALVDGALGQRGGVNRTCPSGRCAPLVPYSDADRGIIDYFLIGLAPTLEYFIGSLMHRMQRGEIIHGNNRAHYVLQQHALDLRLGALLARRVVGRREHGPRLLPVVTALACGVYAAGCGGVGHEAVGHVDRHVLGTDGHVTRSAP